MNQQTSLEQIAFRYVETNQELAECCQRWKSAPALAMDTEFMRVTTFYPKAALFQVSDGKENVLIDPLRIDAWDCFRELLLNPHCIKVLHSCSEDLIVFQHFLDMVPAPIFDTQIASSMLEHGLSPSYQTLVNHYCGQEIPKGETRSDWLQRPLTVEQMEYAALDVAFLLDIWRHQKQQLEALQRTDWMDEECGRLAEVLEDEIRGDFSLAYRNFKAAWQLDGQQLACLQLLAQWRENRARDRDKPRNWIIRDSALFHLARSMPTAKAQLAVIEDIGDNFVRYEGERVLALIAEAKALPAAQYPPPIARPFSQTQKQKLKKARDIVEQKATELCVAPEFLGRKKTLHALFYALLDKTDTDKPIPKELQGWREPLLLQPLLEALQ